MPILRSPLLRPPSIVRRPVERLRVVPAGATSRQEPAIVAGGDVDFARVTPRMRVGAVRAVRVRRNVRMPLGASGRKRAVRIRGGAIDLLITPLRAARDLRTCGSRGATDFFITLARTGRGLRDSGRRRASEFFINLPRADRFLRGRGSRRATDLFISSARAERVVRVRVVTYVRRAAGRGRSGQRRGSSNCFAKVVLRFITRGRLV